MALKVLDIFSGGGGSSWGARAAGISPVCAIDRCPIATATYKENFPGAEVITSRLEDICPDTLRNRIGEIDILLASPECTSHTCAKGSSPRSEESRATAMQVIRFARASRPRWIVMENVPHMRPWSRYGELKSELMKLGYRLCEQILDASEFGVPQKRRRLFLTADIEQEPKSVIPPANKPVRPASEVLDLEGTWKTTPLKRNGRAKGTLERAARAIRALGKNAKFLIVYYGTDGGGGWQTIDRPLRTVTTVDRFALVTPSELGTRMRMLQVPELKRSMGFDEDYQMNSGTRRDRIRLLGNGVCPPVMKAVLSQLTR